MRRQAVSTLCPLRWQDHERAPAGLALVLVGGGCGIRTHGDDHSPQRFSRPPPSATRRTLLAAETQPLPGSMVYHSAAAPIPCCWRRWCRWSWRYRVRRRHPRRFHWERSGGGSGIGMYNRLTNFQLVSATRRSTWWRPDRRQRSGHAEQRDLDLHADADVNPLLRSTGRIACGSGIHAQFLPLGSTIPAS